MKGIWNRLRLALLGGILAFAGAGIVSPLAGGVVAEAAPGDYVQITSADQLKNGQYVLGDLTDGLVYEITDGWGEVSTTENPLVFTLEMAGDNSSFWLGSEDGYLEVPSSNSITLATTKPSTANLKWVTEGSKFGIGNSERILKSNSGRLRFYENGKNQMLNSHFHCMSNWEFL